MADDTPDDERSPQEVAHRIEWRTRVDNTVARLGAILLEMATIEQPPGNDASAEDEGIPVDPVLILVAVSEFAGRAMMLLARGDVATIDRLVDALPAKIREAAHGAVTFAEEMDIKFPRAPTSGRTH